ncbi:nitric oxide reductase transcriptional regulator NorR [Desulfosarcina sp.]|uniref:nitric oxide reductase transcriptional regulator NorR n=1 Tax=Desulfosarcina sp. TaxID=2027861 RepID=UPI003569E417
MEQLDTILSMAVDLTTALNAKDRYQRLLHSIGRVIPYNASTLLRLEGDVLVPIAATGLRADAMGRRFARSEHPRLDIICNADGPVLFPSDTTLPDPFDGLLRADANEFHHIHACLGCPLRMEDQLMGVLTADAKDPHSFDHLEPSFLKAVGALAGAQMQTVNLIEALEQSARRHGQIAADLMKDVQIGKDKQIIGSSPPMVRLRREIELVARSDFTVLVLGETGVGKELVVRAIHAESNRKDGPMLYLNCAAMPETLADSELFGHTKGAFTGAVKDRAGKFEVADKGTLFLDEIGELPLSIQAKLLRAIQEGEIQRVGSEKLITVNVRLLTATNRNLEREVEKGNFREDLFHRLNVYPLSVPALRDRNDDIPLLAGFFSERMQRRLGLGPVRISTEAMETLKRYSWPGNVRELENILSRSILKASVNSPLGEPVIVSPVNLGDDLSAAHTPARLDTQPSPPPLTSGQTLREATKNFQIQVIQRVLDAKKGNWAAAARQLGMHRSNLHNLATRLKIRKKGNRS